MVTPSSEAVASHATARELSQTLNVPGDNVKPVDIDPPLIRLKAVPLREKSNDCAPPPTTTFATVRRAFRLFVNLQMTAWLFATITELFAPGVTELPLSVQASDEA